MTYIIYKKATGAVVKSLVCDEATLELNVAQDEEFVTAASEANGDLYWVEHPARILRARSDYTLDALPLPCIITIEGVSYGIHEQPTEWGFDAPGSYTLVVDAGPEFLIKEFIHEVPS